MRRPLRRSALPVLLTTVTLLVAVPVGQASAAVTYTGTLAGPSIAAMYPSGLEWDDVNDRIVVADTGLDKVQFYSITGTKQGEFGTHGTGNGQFDSPRDAAVDEAGNIYIADAGNNRVQAFTSAGAFLWSQGGTGPCNTCLNTPIGVTWDAANDQLLIASTGQDLIKSFNGAGDWVWTSPPTAPVRTRSTSTRPETSPAGPTAASGSRTTTNTSSRPSTSPPPASGRTPRRHARWAGATATGSSTSRTTWTSASTGRSPTSRTRVTTRSQAWNIAGPSPVFVENIGGDCPETPEPCADPPADFGYIDTLRRVVVTETGELITADFWGNGMQVWEADGDPIREIELAAAPAPGFAQAFGVATAPNGDVYVMDRLNQRMQRFNSAGQFISQAGSRGTSPGKLSWPEAIAVGPDGTVWAGDTRGDQVQRWPANLSSSPAPKEYPANPASGSAVGKFNYIEDLDVAPNGNVYVADTNNNRIQYFTPPTGNALATFTAFGAIGNGQGQFDHPQGVAVSSTNVFVADTDNDRIQKLTLNGHLRRVLLDRPRRTAGHRARARRHLVGRRHQRQRDRAPVREPHEHRRRVRLAPAPGTCSSTCRTRSRSRRTSCTSPTPSTTGCRSSTPAQPAPTRPPPRPRSPCPRRSQVFPNAPITFSGTAADNVGVSTVKVAIKDTARPAGSKLVALDTAPPGVPTSCRPPRSARPVARARTGPITGPRRAPAPTACSPRPRTRR